MMAASVQTKRNSILTGMPQRCFTRAFYLNLILIAFVFCGLTFLLLFQYVERFSVRDVIYYNVTIRDDVTRKVAMHTVGYESVTAKTNSATDSIQFFGSRKEFEMKAKAMHLKPISRLFINDSDTTNISYTYPLTINTPYLIENPILCSSVKNLSVLTIVHTATDHFERRDSARRTWTNETYFKGLGTLRILFLLGRTNNDNIQKRIEEEAATHGDILQGDFIDAYRNLTHKGVMGYKWITERCRNAKIIVKIDDDVLVNTYMLFNKYIPYFKNKKKQIVCNHILPGTMPIVRKKKSKWFVSEDLFPKRKFYGRYCSGFMVMINNDVIPAIYRSATVTPFFWVDDVYLYGLVPTRVPGIKYISFGKRAREINGQMALKCYKNATKTCNFLVVGAARPHVADELWMFMTKQYKEKLLPASVTEAPVKVPETADRNPKQSIKTKPHTRLSTKTQLEPMVFINKNDSVNIQVLSGKRKQYMQHS